MINEVEVMKFSLSNLMTFIPYHGRWFWIFS